MNRKCTWSMIVEACDVAEEVAKSVSAEFVKFEDSDFTETVYAIFKVGDRVVKVPCDEIFTDIDFPSKVRMLAERVVEHVKDGLFC